MNEFKLLPVELDSSSNIKTIHACLKKYNFVKLNGFLRHKKYLLDQLRDAIEMADFFQMTYRKSESTPSNKDIALDRFRNIETTNKIPYLKLDDLPFGMVAAQKLLQQAPFPQIFNAHMPNASSFFIHSSIARPAQNSNSKRSTDWQWHQDTKFHRSKNDFSIWIPLVDCGVDAPGLQFLVAPDLKTIFPLDPNTRWCMTKELQDQLQNKYNYYAPKFLVGDCILFNTYAIHKTYVKPEMSRDRTSVDLRISFTMKQ